MSDPLQILGEVRIASPCPVPWEDMTGDDRVRHCGACDCRVYNVSAMTAEDGVRLLREHEGRLCIQLWRRADGTLITADCPVGLRERARRCRRKLAAVGSTIAAFFLPTGCAEEVPNNYTGGPPAAAPPSKSSREFMERSGMLDSAHRLGGYVSREDRNSGACE